ncbi:MAG: sensor histidine kinase [Bacteroidota bacterium]
MNTILQRYRPIWLGAIFTLVSTVLLSLLGVIRINPTAIGENIAIFTMWWVLIALALYYIPRIKNKRRLLQHLGVLVGLHIIIFMVEYNIDMEDNPATFALLGAMCVYFIYWLMPIFFGKYRAFVIGVYGAIWLIFAYGRLVKDNYFDYQEEYILSFMWPLLFFAILWLYEQWKWFRSLQSDKATAELALLKSQINPHFFFNTLNNLHALALEQSKETPEVICQLSDMMRYTIYEGKKDWVRVSEEVAYLQNYIELHEIRQHQKVNITFDEDVTAGVMVSPLLFIPLLENAFKHGAERLISDAFIDIQLTATHEKIFFQIRNNFDPTETVTKMGGGIGLSNLRRRLELVYPDQHQLDIKREDNIYTATLIIELETV